MHNSLEIKSVKDLYNFPVEEIDWRDISMFLEWKEGDLREWADYVDWKAIAYNFQGYINRDIMREFRKVFDSNELGTDRYWDSVWGIISWRKIFSDDTAEEFMDKFEVFSWDLIKNQPFLSEQFIERWSDILNLKDISTNKVVSKEFKQKCQQMVK